MKRNHILGFHFSTFTLISLSFLASSFVFAEDNIEESDETQYAELVLPDSLMDKEHERSELGVNEYTAPSIRKIFENLQSLPPVSNDFIKIDTEKKLPMFRADLAIELGYFIADGFFTVRKGELSKVRPLAQQISRYAKALGAGERVNRHAAMLLKHAEEGDESKLKDELALTQRDVEAELISLRDPDLTHFIGLGGWIHALEGAISSVLSDNSPDKLAKAKIIFQPEIPEYFDEALAGLDPLMVRQKDVSALRSLLKQLQKNMTLPPDQLPTNANLTEMNQTVSQLSTVALTRNTSK